MGLMLGRSPRCSEGITWGKQHRAIILDYAGLRSNDRHSRHLFIPKKNARGLREWAGEIGIEL